MRRPCVAPVRPELIASAEFESGVVRLCYKPGIAPNHADGTD
jgi:hypothetical protein